MDDESGGTSGIITIEELLKESFGDIRDDYDIKEFTEQRISEHEYMYSGRPEIDYLNTTYGI